VEGLAGLEEQSADPLKEAVRKTRPEEAALGMRWITQQKAAEARQRYHRWLRKRLGIPEEPP
jgi:hypothetical protein